MVALTTRRSGAILAGALTNIKGHSMAFTDSTLRNCQLLVATAFALGALSTVALAYTAEQQQMCTGDAMRLCSSEIPDSIASPPAWSRTRAAQRRLQGRLSIRAAAAAIACELRARGKTRQAAQPDPAQARLGVFLIKSQRHVPVSRTWRLLVSAARDNKHRRSFRVQPGRG